MPAMYMVMIGEGLGGEHFIFMNKTPKQMNELMKPQLNSLQSSTISKKILLCVGFIMFIMMRDYLYL